MGRVAVTTALARCLDHRGPPQPSLGWCPMFLSPNGELVFLLPDGTEGFLAVVRRARPDAPGARRFWVDGPEPLCGDVATGSGALSYLRAAGRAAHNLSPAAAPRPPMPEPPAVPVCRCK